MGVPDPEEGEIWGRIPSENMQLEIAAATWQIETRNDSAFPKLLWTCCYYYYKCKKQQFIHLLTAAFQDLHIKNSKNHKKVILPASH